MTNLLKTVFYSALKKLQQRTLYIREYKEKNLYH